MTRTHARRRGPGQGHRDAASRHDDDSTLRAVIRDELRSLLARLVDAVPPYATHRDGPRPDGWGLRAWQRVAPTITGAVRRGRYVYVARSAYEEWRAGPILTPTSAQSAEQWSPSAALSAAGLRAIDGGRR